MAVFKDKGKTKDGRSWYFKVYKKDFSGINKAYKSKRFLTKKEAQEEEAIFLLKRDNPINKPFILISKEFFKEMYKIRKESTVYSYENAYKKQIEPYFRNFNINSISVSDINEWHTILEKKHFKIAYLNKLHNILKSIFDYAIKNYGLENNPVAILGRFQQKNDKVIKDEEKLRYITFEEFNKLISVIDDIMWKTFFILLYYTGMRKGEVQALTWNDIDFYNHEIIVNKTLSVKTKQAYVVTSTKNCVNRKIKMSNNLEQQLIQYKDAMKEYTDFSEKWFVFGCSRFLPQTNIDRYKNSYFKKANINPITIHEFRHSHVSLLINEYIKTGQTDTTKFFLMMSDRMGHTVDVMIRTYMHLFPTVQNEIVDILNNL